MTKLWENATGAFVRWLFTPSKGEAHGHSLSPGLISHLDRQIAFQKDRPDLGVNRFTLVRLPAFFTQQRLLRTRHLSIAARAVDRRLAIRGHRTVFTLAIVDMVDDSGNRVLTPRRDLATDNLARPFWCEIWCLVRGLRSSF